MRGRQVRKTGKEEKPPPLGVIEVPAVDDRGSVLRGRLARAQNAS